MIKVTGNFSDLMMAHTTWTTYVNTNRIYKFYTLNFNDSTTTAKTLSFSSYPGFLESLDDYYMMSRFV